MRPLKIQKIVYGKGGWKQNFKIVRFNYEKALRGSFELYLIQICNSIIDDLLGGTISCKEFGGVLVPSVPPGSVPLC